MYNSSWVGIYYLGFFTNAEASERDTFSGMKKILLMRLMSAWPFSGLSRNFSRALGRQEKILLG